ncbi:MAG: hypothetical protein KGD63_14720 [Candidatus Lokiarchaeota archaeon]|nr:hypothetical protein [Candidatus Lokiarchaeota archaeon]
MYIITFIQIIGKLELNVIFWILTIWSPTISAIIVTGLIKGRSGIKNLLKKLLIWKFSYKWYLAAIVITLAPLTVAIFYTYIWW